MCTSIILFRKKNLWPVIIGTNRDERLDRKSLIPDRHWKKKYPNIVGGKDLEKNGLFKINPKERELLNYYSNSIKQFFNKD